MNQNLPILSDLAQAALECAARGLHVFPAPPGKKKSYKSAEHSDGRAWGAMTDSAEIARDWRRWPSANLGLVTGPKSGFFVVEADTLDGHGVDGIANLAKLIEQNGDRPETIEALSPSGSWHVWFRWPEAGGVFNSEGEIAPGVDVRGDGGMVLAPPSVKPNAAKPYQWKNSPDAFPLADCPEWLLKFCRKEHKAKRSEGAASQASLGSVSAEDRVRVLTLLGRARNTLARPDWINLCIALKGTLGDVGRGGWRFRIATRASKSPVRPSASGTTRSRKASWASGQSFTSCAHWQRSAARRSASPNARASCRASSLSATCSAWSSRRSSGLCRAFCPRA